MKDKKKLLILGGINPTLSIVEQAHSMDIDVYVTDYLADSPAKVVADKSFMVSASDVDEVVNLIQDEKIDGILTGYVDLLLPYYVDICKKSGLPCYATKEQIEITTDKVAFKEICGKFNIRTIPGYTKQEVDAGSVQYPILVKPVDNSGARGIYICHNQEEFNINYKKSLEFSKSKHVLIEQYITSLKEATIFYYFHNGEVYLMGMADRHMLKFSDKVLPLPVGYTFPSNILPQFLKKEHLDITRMFESMGMAEGMAFIQTCVDNSHIYVYEMGYRLTGSQEHYLFAKSTGFNPLKELINFAVGNTIQEKDIKKINPSIGIMGNVTLLINKGTISQIIGLDIVGKMKTVLSVKLSYHIGETITDKIIGTLSQAAVRVLLVADTKEQLIKDMDTIKDTISVLDQFGKEMLIKDYSYHNIC